MTNIFNSTYSLVQRFGFYSKSKQCFLVTCKVIWVAVIILLLAMFYLPNSSQAELIQNIFIGNAKALGLANAVTADPPGIDSIHYNPAGLTRLKQPRQYQINFIGVQADIRGEFDSSASYAATLEILGLDDPVLGEDGTASSRIEGFSIYQPGKGIVDIPTATSPPMIGAPLFGVAFHPPNSKITFANAMYSTMIGGFNRADDDPGRYSVKRVGFTRLTYFSPSIGYQFSDTLSFGASIGFSYFGLGVETDFRVNNLLFGTATSASEFICDSFDAFCNIPAFTDSLGSIQLEVEDLFSPTFNIGVLWQPNPRFAWGAVYQSAANDTLKGTLKIDYSDDIDTLIEDANDATSSFVQSILDSILAAGWPYEAGVEEVDAELDFVLPQHFATGISYIFIPRWKLNFDVKWTGTGSWDEFMITWDESMPIFGLIDTLATPIGLIDEISANSFILPRKYEDVWTWAIGFEHQFSDRLLFRFGYEPRKSAIPDDQRDFLVPIGDADLYGFGANYKINNTSTIDISFGYIKSKEYIESGTSEQGNSCEIDSWVYSPYCGINIEHSLTVYLLEVGYHSVW